MDTKIRTLQLLMLDILKMVDKICVENNIKYSLYGGTLLGAVRHKGFIPWDDDLDICMDLINYNRFLEIWDQIKPQGYILQNKENDSNFTQSFTKIRKDHTTFLQYDSERGKYHTGIFIDIFPIYRLPKKKLQRLCFYWNCMRYQLYTREFLPPKSNPAVKFVSKVLLSAVSPSKRPALRKKLLKKMIQYEKNSSLDMVGIDTMESLAHHFPCEVFSEYIKIWFEDMEFMCIKFWDKQLKCEYGNYMELPPESERVWKHHPIILDFEHSYEEIIKC